MSGRSLMDCIQPDKSRNMKEHEVSRTAGRSVYRQLVGVVFTTVEQD